MNRDGQSGYSLIMSAFQGRYRAFQEASEREFGRKGLSAFSLCLRPEALPAEIANGMSEEEAKRIAESLEEVGATIIVVPSHAVDGVRFYAEECWPQRSEGYWNFSEVDGMILTLSSINARGNVKAMRVRSPEAKSWQIEAALNHQHPTHEYSRHALRRASEMGADLSTALRVAYPERRFIVDYWEDQISFYQQGGGAPEHDEPPPTMPEKTWCEVCRGNKPYRLRQEIDPEFSKADWGDCMECGAEVLVRSWRFRTRV